MTIERIENGNEITLKLGGWLDTASAPELGEALDGISAASAIVLDMDNVEYIASAGLRQVVACHKKARELDADFSVINAGMEVFSIFRLTGLDKKISISGK